MKWKPVRVVGSWNGSEQVSPIWHHQQVSI